MPRLDFRVHKEILARLAHVVTLCAEVEHYQGAVLGRMLQSTRFPRIWAITQNVSANTVSGWMRTLLDVPNVEDELPVTARHFKMLLDVGDELRASRNALVHGVWKKGPQPKTALVHTIRLDRKEVMKDELVTLGDLHDLASNLEVLAYEFGGLATSDKWVKRRKLRGVRKRKKRAR